MFSFDDGTMAELPMRQNQYIFIGKNNSSDQIFQEVWSFRSDTKYVISSYMEIVLELLNA